MYKTNKKEQNCLDIVLQRVNHGKGTCDGIVMIDGKKVCASVENPDCHVPAGRYGVRIAKSDTWGRQMPVLVSLPADMNGEEEKPVASIGFGNGAFGRNDGSIIVGEYLVSGVVIHSLACFTPLFERIRSCLRRCGKVVVTIV